MPIAINYQPDYAVVADASLAGAGGLAAENMRRWNAEFGEGQRQFDLNYDYRLNMAALEDDRRRRALSQQYDLEAGRMGLYQQNAAMDYDLAQQQLQQRAAETEADNQRMLTAKQMEVAERFAAMNFEQAMAAEKAAREIFPRLTPAQQQQVIQQHEERFGIPWGGAERMLAQQQEAQMQQQRQRWKEAITDSDGQSLLPDAFIDDAMAMDPEKSWAIIGKAMAEKRQREAAELKSTAAEQEFAWKEREKNDDQEIKRQEFEQRQVQAEQEREQQGRTWRAEQAAAIASAKAKALIEYQKALAAYNKNKSTARNDESGAALGPPPSKEDFWTPDVEAEMRAAIESDGGDDSNTLQPGETIVTNPAGKRAILSADGKTIRKRLD